MIIILSLVYCRRGRMSRSPVPARSHMHGPRERVRVYVFRGLAGAAVSAGRGRVRGEAVCTRAHLQGPCGRLHVRVSDWMDGEEL